MTVFGMERAHTGGVDILGVRFHVCTTAEVIEQILMWVDEQSRRMVITAGPEFVMMTRTDQVLKHITHVADLVTPDGIGVVWAARRQRIDIRERVTGVELVQQLLTKSATRKQTLRVYVLGAEQRALEFALTALRVHYPEHTFAGKNGYFQPEDIPSVLADVENFQPHVWLVGLGQPRQEKFIYESLGKVAPCVAIGVGGSIDVWGGTVKRAPAVFRRMNMEWLYRLVRQPSRWRRQLALPRFAWEVLRNSGPAD